MTTNYYSGQHAQYGTAQGWQSSSPIKNQTFTLPLGSIGASGEFIDQKNPDSALIAVPPIWNPGVYDNLRNSHRILTCEPLNNPITEILQSEYPQVWQMQFDGYGEVFVELAQSVVKQKAHLNLGLLRGAYRPCIFVEVMTRGEIRYEFVNYTQHTEREAEIVKHLNVLLGQYDPQTAEFRIQVTDTAVGGDGGQHLARMLRGIKTSNRRFQHQRWTIMLNLVHDLQERANPDNMRAIVRENRSSIRFEVTLHKVPNLLTEDYDAGLGLKFDRGIVNPFDESGKLLLNSDTGVSLIESDNMRLTFDQFFSGSVTEVLLTSPEYRQISDIWRKAPECSRVPSDRPKQ